MVHTNLKFLETVSVFGARYYDLCASCEPNTTHYPAHTFVKITGEGNKLNRETSGTPVTQITVKYDGHAYPVIKLYESDTPATLLEILRGFDNPALPQSIINLSVIGKSVTKGIHLTDLLYYIKFSITGIFKVTTLDAPLNDRSQVSFSVEITLSHNSRPLPPPSTRLACRRCF